jgi:iron(III) transport system ATP-binding protein
MTSDAAMPYLELEGIGKSFGSFTALRDIRLSIPRGELVCFLGPSGCGKTTLLRIIAGLETQTTGTLRQGGRDISTLPPTKRDYGIVFQSYALFPNLTVFDNVAYGLVNRRAARDALKARVEELLGLVGLPRAGGKYPSQLSGGEQQRIALARALATSPGLLLLDEPLSALDAIVRLHLRQEIRELQRRLGVTTILVTHDQEEALTMADRIVVMNQGAIDQVGTPAQIYREPATPFVAEFVGRVNVLEGRVEAGGRMRIGERVFRCAGGAEVGTEVRAYLRPEDIATTAMGAAGPDAVGATVEKLDFLGWHCLARVATEGLAGQALTLYLSPDEVAAGRIGPGSPLRLSIAESRIRIFDA